MTPAVEINLERCRAIASVVRTLRLPRDPVRQAIFSSDRKVVGNFNLLLVAICHQTQSIHGVIDGTWCRGWDYLERRLNEYCQSNPDFLEIRSWATLSRASLERALGQSNEDVAVIDAAPRVQLINDLGYQMMRAGYGSFEQLYDAKRRRSSGETSIISFLKEQTQAYSDPVEKKARLLIGLLRDAHGWEFSQDGQLGAPVDYHEIRGHLRLGTVVINDEVLKQKIKSDSVSDRDDRLIREGISTAIDTIARDAIDVDPLGMHYIFWNYFRAICKRERPNCSSRTGPALEQLDMAYAETFKTSAWTSGCAFSSVCRSFKDQTFGVEYRYQGTYY
jgi:hypothetical protein